MRPAAPVLFKDARRSRRLRAPPGVSQDALNALVKFAGSGLGDNMLAIDRAANNTSIVLELEWRGWRLLFSGDAELRSWRTMDRQGQLRPVHFLKVSHHASHNGTPPEALLENVLPIARADKRPRYALVSTCAGTYSGVPDDETLARIARRVDRVYFTNEVKIGKAIEIKFESLG
jgi:beta-lactamase superfamily II metal-dependent hydrolase